MMQRIRKSVNQHEAYQLPEYQAKSKALLKSDILISDPRLLICWYPDVPVIDTAAYQEIRESA